MRLEQNVSLQFRLTFNAHAFSCSTNIYSTIKKEFTISSQRYNWRTYIMKETTSTTDNNFHLKRFISFQIIIIQKRAIVANIPYNTIENLAYSLQNVSLQFRLTFNAHAFSCSTNIYSLLRKSSQSVLKDTRNFLRKRRRRKIHFKF